MLPLPTLPPLLDFLVFSSIWHLKWSYRKPFKKTTPTNPINQAMVHLYLCYICAVNLEHSGHICACTGKITGDLSLLDVLRIPYVFAMDQIYCACSGQWGNVSEVLWGTFNTLALLHVRCKVHLPVFLLGISWAEMWGPCAWSCVTGCKWNPQLHVVQDPTCWKWELSACFLIFWIAEVCLIHQSL